MPKYAKFKTTFDAKQSMRKFDDNGYLHVALTPISKACVNPYYGWEIPDGEKWNLRPNEIYFGLRDPSELKAGADTFNGLPLLMDHHSISAEMPAKEYVCGSTGTDAVFDGIYLKNSLSVIDADAIRSIEDGSAKEISCAYRFDPDFTSGEFDTGGEKVHYDFIMRNIRGNHVALVAEGRAGHDVAVADAMPEIKRKEKEGMRKRKLVNDSIDKLISEFAPDLDEAHRAAFKAALTVVAQAEIPPKAIGVMTESPENKPVEVLEAEADEAEMAKAKEAEKVEESEPVEEMPTEKPAEAPAEEVETVEAVEEKPEKAVEEKPEEDADKVPENEEIDAKVDEKVDEALESTDDPKAAAQKLAEALKDLPAEEDDEVVDADEVPEKEVAEKVEEKAVEEKPVPEKEESDDLEKLLDDPQFKAGFDLGLATRAAFEESKKAKKEIPAEKVEEKAVVVEESNEDAPDPAVVEEVVETTEIPEETTETTETQAPNETDEEKEEIFGQDTAARLKAQASENAKQYYREIIRAAEKVKPLIGNIVDPLAFDSADDIYRLAIEKSGRDASKYDRKSYRAMVDVLVDTKPAYAKVAPKTETKPEDERDHFRFLKNISR